MESLDNSTSMETFTNSLLETGLLVDKYYTPLLCLFGALGNSLSLAVFWLDNKYRSQSASYYLSALAISDTGFLLSLFLVWLEIVHGQIITSPFTCPLVMYLGQVTCFTSVYLIVAFSIERYVAVHYPFSRNRICTKTNGRRVISCLLLLSLLLFSYVWVIAKVIEFRRYSQQTSPEPDMHNLDEISKAINLTTLNKHSLGVKAFIQQFRNKTDDAQDDKAFNAFLLHVFGLVDESSQQVDDVTMVSTVSSVAEEKAGESFIKHCTVPEQYYKISEVANYTDSIVTLLIPFLLITYLNVRIYISIWKYMNERHKIMASPSLQTQSEERSQSIMPALLTNNYANEGFRSANPSTSIHMPNLSPPNDLFEEESESSRCEWRLEVQVEKRKRRVSFSLSCCSSASIKRERSMGNFRESNPLENEVVKPMMRRSRSVGTSINTIRREHVPMRQRHTPIEVRVTKTLLLVSTVFLVLNLPLHVIRCAQFFQYMSGSSGGMEILRAIQPWANLLFNTNFAVNFLLYCVSGRNFRNSLHRFVTSRLSRKSQPLNLQFSSQRQHSRISRQRSRGIPQYRRRTFTTTLLGRINRRNSSNATVSTVAEDKGPQETELVELGEMMGSLFENRSRLLGESTQREVYD